MLLIELLRCAAEQPAANAAERLLVATIRASDREFQWLLDSGFGPLLNFRLQSLLHRVSRTRQDMLRAADLVAQVQYGDVADTVTQVIDVATKIGTQVTLLKGISISEQYYAKPHFRRMSDIDVLVPKAAYAVIESELLRQGFVRGGQLVDDDHNHGVPLLNAVNGTWVELHTGLVPASSELRNGRPFRAIDVSANTICGNAFGRQIGRLSNELQIVYISCTWNFDMTMRRYHPSFVAGVFDGMVLLSANRNQINWSFIFDGIDNEMAAASLLILLSFLKRHEAPLSIPPLDALAKRQQLVGPVQLRAIHWALDRYLLAGKKWSAPVPPPVAGRYGIRRQFRKRIVRRSITPR